jgi:hypothetical protein
VYAPNSSHMCFAKSRCCPVSKYCGERSRVTPSGWGKAFSQNTALHTSQISISQGICLNRRELSPLLTLSLMVWMYHLILGTCSSCAHRLKLVPSNMFCRGSNSRSALHVLACSPCQWYVQNTVPRHAATMGTCQLFYTLTVPMCRP